MNYEIKSSCDILPVDLSETTIFKDLLLSKSYGLCVAQPKNGKSLLILELLACALLGKDFMGFECLNPIESALYVYGEGGSGLGRRLEALREKHRDPLATLYCMTHEEFCVYEHSHNDLLIRAISQQCDLSPQIIVFDTIRSMAGNHSDTDNVSTAKLFSNAKALIKEFECSVIYVHHTLKNSNTYAGGVNVRGATDFLWSVSDGAFWADSGKETPESDKKYFQLMPLCNSVVIVPSDHNAIHEQVDYAEIESGLEYLKNGGDLIAIRVGKAIWGDGKTSLTKRQKEVVTKVIELYRQSENSTSYDIGEP